MTRKAGPWGRLYRDGQKWFGAGDPMPYVASFRLRDVFHVYMDDARVAVTADRKTGEPLTVELEKTFVEALDRRLDARVRMSGWLDREPPPDMRDAFHDPIDWMRKVRATIIAATAMGRRLPLKDRNRVWFQRV